MDLTMSGCILSRASHKGGTEGSVEAADRARELISLKGTAWCSTYSSVECTVAPVIEVLLAVTVLEHGLEVIQARVDLFDLEGARRAHDRTRL